MLHGVIIEMGVGPQIFHFALTKSNTFCKQAPYFPVSCQAMDRAVRGLLPPAAILNIGIGWFLLQQKHEYSVDASGLFIHVQPLFLNVYPQCLRIRIGAVPLVRIAVCPHVSLGDIIDFQNPGQVCLCCRYDLLRRIGAAPMSLRISIAQDVFFHDSVIPPFFRKTKTAANRTVKWKSSNKKYATVNSKGVVTVKKAGIGKKVTITATAKDGSGKKATYRIKIMKKAVKKITLKASKTKVTAGKKVTIKATVTPGKNVNKKLTYKSSNKKYATVNSKGVVTTRKAGKGKTVKIIATATDGSGKKATIKIKIK